MSTLEWAIGLAGAVISLAAASFFHGKSKGKKEGEEKRNRDYVQGRKDVDEILQDKFVDRDAVRKRLRDFANGGKGSGDS